MDIAHYVAFILGGITVGGFNAIDNEEYLPHWWAHVKVGAKGAAWGGIQAAAFPIILPCFLAVLFMMGILRLAMLGIPALILYYIFGSILGETWGWAAAGLYFVPTVLLLTCEWVYDRIEEIQ